MNVVEFLVSLLDVHKQQLKALTRQGEIQANVLSQLVKDGLTKTLDRSSPQDEEEQRRPRMTPGRDKDPEDWGARLAGLLQEETQKESQPIRPQGLSNAFQTRVQGQMWTVEDKSRQDFLSLRYDPQKGARELGQRLDSAAKHWLRPDLRTAAQVEQCVAMEQFLSILPKEAGAWVQKQQPRDMEEAISMAEQRLGSGVFTVSSPAPTHTDTAQSSTEAQEQGLEIPDMGVASYQEEKDEHKGVPEEGSIFVCKQEIEDPDWHQKSAPPKPIQMSVSTTGHESMSVDTPYIFLSRNNPLSSTMYTHPTPTVSSQIPSPQSPLAPDAYHPQVQDSPVIDRLRSNASSDETELTARYTRLISEDGQLTWGTPPSVPSPSFHTRPPSPSPSHQCPDCGCCFAQQRNLEEHRNIHTGARPFVCGVCGKAFCHRRTLNKHTRIHSWERPFQCTDCGQTFKLKDTMKRHQVSHSRPGVGPGAHHRSHSP
ncbi:zinc finger and SCAN domain-containing protein 21-like isoform X2 [Coregonus clupeaformis]|uniref:zinc finger and SCAN domain-containing protein 21-like isoform X2 n=1 Tax=Coregonus clupeaformis TaxID=59861 RepID=UPI001BE09D07|nr:zinc finger and SCAN domain-containing protein 21-like isoform X2 [Coregonus clupeaformis]